MTNLDLPTGTTLGQSDPGYDEARAMWNGRFDRTPDLVVRCRSTEDVVAAVDHAVASGQHLSVRGGGHSYAGLSVQDGGLLIDLSGMSTVEVDAERRVAVVGPGATCADLDSATQAHALATPTPTVSSVGVVGAALGGGTGYLTRKHGLLLDNVISAEVVTADGRVVTASEDENPELFWAIRGGGGNFGVVTRMELRLHPLGPTVLAGQIIHRFDEAGRLLRVFRDLMIDAPPGFQSYPFCFRVPPLDLFPEELHGQPVLDFVLLHEDPGAGDFVQPLRDAADPVLDLVGPSPYVEAQQSFDANLPKGERYLSKAHDLPDLSDGAIDTMVEYVPRMMGSLTAAYFDPFGAGGAVGEVPTEATAFAGREARYGFHIIAGWQDPVEDDSVSRWASEFHQEMGEHATGGVYVNLIADDEQDRVSDAYGPNFDRLKRLKAEWDPTNLFASNYNIEPVDEG